MIKAILLIYLLSGISGGLLSTALNGDGISVGASGAIFGLFAAVYVLVSTLKNFHDFQVTREEYAKEKEELRKIHLENKLIKKNFKSRK